jgi:hypothetical protein
MAETKYGKHIISKELLHTFGRGFDGTSMLSHDGELNANVSIGYHCLHNTKYAHEVPHEHDFHELLCFIGGNPLDINDFGAEIHICLGEEQEEHIITSPSVVSIPPGLTHCPLTVAKCDKPIVFLEISLTGKFDSSEMKANREKEEAEKNK